MKAKVMPDGRISLPARLRRKHGLEQGCEVIVEDAGDAIVLRTFHQVVARAQALSRKLVAGQAGASVEDFWPIAPARICGVTKPPIGLGFDQDATSKKRTYSGDVVD